MLKLRNGYAKPQSGTSCRAVRSWFMYAHGRGVPRSETEAATWYRKAADQGDAPAMNNLAVLLATSNDPKIRNPKEAVSVAEKAVEVQPENASYLDTLATAYFEAGPTDKAAETEQRALTLKPDDPSYKKALEKYEAASRHTGTLIPKSVAHLRLRRTDPHVRLLILGGALCLQVHRQRTGFTSPASITSENAMTLRALAGL